MAVWHFWTSSLLDVMMGLYLPQYITRKPAMIVIYNSCLITHLPTNNLLVALLFSRSSTDLSSLVQHAEEEPFIFQALSKNAYVKNFIRRCQNQITSKQLLCPSPISSKKKKQLELPFNTHKVNPILSKDFIPLWHINSLYTTNHPKSNYIKHKDATPSMMKSGIVYEIACQECYATYIGQTGRYLS